LLTYPTTTSSQLDLALGLLTVPVLFGLILLRQSAQTIQQLSQFSESLLQGEQLPILERCPPVQIKFKHEAVPYESLPPDSRLNP
jgi:hypothetical protein